MSRASRSYSQTGVYHILFRGVNQQNVFEEKPEEDRCAFFVALSRAKKEIMFTFCEYRNSSKYPKQSHNQINEFFELLKNPGVASIVCERDRTEY